MTAHRIALWQAADAGGRAGRRAAADRGVLVTVCVVDASLEAVALSRMDGAFPSSAAVALAKARAAMNFGQPTSDLAARIPAHNLAAFAAVEPRMMVVGGGHPVAHARVVVAAVGVSGGLEDDDVHVATAVATAIERALADGGHVGDDPDPSTGNP